MQAKIWLLCGALLGGSAIGLGAYRAHGLETRLRAEAHSDSEVTAIPNRLTDCETAVRYQMFQAVALLCIGLLAERGSTCCLTGAGICFLLGTILFAGPLYLLSLFDLHLHWAIIPAGGAVMIAGWVMLAVAALKRKPPGSAL
ncbi:MAG TPA: DUF423 domain-containing protein [Pirellulales bacterium]|jgi:uncharacterized membrane protein YgdD (TMEM256/DUF423 family)|nr:DUF423 domain-containing protein [Pirellulales bacterium]